MIGYYVDHQVDVVTRRTRYEKRKRRGARLHIVQGLLIALDHLDEVIEIIRASAGRRRGPHEADEEVQAAARSRRTTSWTCRCAASRGWRAQSSTHEHKELLARIKYLDSLLKDPKKLRGVIKDELAEIRKKLRGPRRTQIKADEGEFDVEDLIAEEDVVITVSARRLREAQSDRRVPRQGRGGKGVKGANLKEEDVIKNVFTTTTHHWLLFFTTQGKVYRVKVARRCPDQSRTGPRAVRREPARASQVERRRARSAPSSTSRSTRRAGSCCSRRRRGMVKKTALPEYDSPRTGLAAINLKDGDELIDVKLTDGKDDVFLVSRKGQTIRFKESLARPMGRATAGVIGMRLAEDDEVIALGLSSEGEEMISVSQNGYGKRSKLADYPVKGRGGKGVIGHQITKKTGLLAGAFIGSKDQDLLTISSAGKVQRVAAEEIRRVGRSSPGRPHDARRGRRDRRRDRARRAADGRGVTRRWVRRSPSRPPSRR